MGEEQKSELPVIVGIRFSKIGKNYYFDATKIGDVKIGDRLVVETSRGWQLGELAEIVTNPEILKNASYKAVDRLATPQDLVKHEELSQKAEQVLQDCKQEIHSQKIGDVKVITAEFSFDERILSFLFTSESEDSPNLNQIKKTLGKKYPNTRIDFHKIGPRDVAKFLGGMGACGFPIRCCSKFLCQFESISIRMAKTQGISLTPADITGMCDRLRCCLAYEHCQYVEALKNMPKRNKVVMTPNGIGKIRDVAPLRECVYVQLEEMGVKEFHISELSEAKQTHEIKRPTPTGDMPPSDEKIQPQGERQPQRPTQHHRNRNRPERPNRPDRPDQQERKNQ